MLCAGDGAAREIGIGKVGNRVGPEDYQHLDLARGRGLEDPVRVESLGGREPPTPRLGEPLAPGIERDPAGQESGNEPGVDRAVHVAAAQGREKANAGDGTQCVGRAHRDGRRLGQRRAAQHDDHRAGSIPPRAADLRQRIGIEILARQGS